MATKKSFLANGFLLTIKYRGDYHHTGALEQAFFTSTLTLCNSMLDGTEGFGRSPNGNDFCDLIAHIMRDDRGLT